MLTVRDHGPGIAAEDLPHIFDRFYRGAEARGRPGSGLGLAIVRQVVEQHGGSIAAKAAPGGGTSMRVRLPRAECVTVEEIRSLRGSITHSSHGSHFETHIAADLASGQITICSLTHDSPPAATRTLAEARR